MSDAQQDPLIQPHVSLPQRSSSPRARSAPLWNSGLFALVSASSIGCLVFAYSQLGRDSAPSAAVPPAARVDPAPAPSGLPPSAQTPSPQDAGSTHLTQILGDASASPAPDASARLAAAAEQKRAPFPAWTKARPSQEWAWPRHLAGYLGQSATWRPFAGQKTGPRPKTGYVSQRILSWDPSRPGGDQVTYLLETGDGKEKQLSESALARQTDASARAAREHHAPTMQRLAAMAGVVGVTDVSGGAWAGQFEIQYADGHKEVRRIDPLVFDLDGRGVKTDHRKVLFDLMGLGANKIQWMNDMDAGTGILVFDSDGAGKSGKSGRDLFGDGTDLQGRGLPSGYVNGFEALRAFVQKAVDNGVLPADVLSRGILDADCLARLEQAYGLRMKIGGFNQKPVSLAAAGVLGISLSQAPPKRIEDFDGQSNLLLAQPGAVFLRRDGTTGNYMNVFLAAKQGNPGL